MKRKLRRFAAISYRRARKIVVFIIGGTIVLAGAAMIVLPGPAFVVIPIGLGVLAIEFAWARRWLRRIKDTADDGVNYVRMWTGRKRPGDADANAPPPVTNQTK